MNALIIFAKTPVKGRVKTRLQKNLSQAEALKLYKGFLFETVNLADKVKNCKKIIACYPDERHPYFKKIAKRFGFHLIKQHGRDLGDRMKNALAEFLDKGFKKAVIIGCDSPTLPKEYIESAFRGLDKKRIIIGPSCDGGYYLIGVRDMAPPIFNDIEWGTRDVLKETLKRIPKKMLPSFHLLPFWYDIDTADDLEFLKAHKRILNAAIQKTR
ncbi:MAG: TIGR04282 family arsenosugar biosynthesis glycosyltransferase [Nitrospirae bacterium]|nr:TIGR04282 family arsenosugar biosynthesis glycosyltransferase [Nitrospirota bacterium]